MKYVRHVDPPVHRDATGRIRGMYDHARRVMMRLPEPVSMFSQRENLALAGWATLYESLVVGEAARGLKEAVAAGVADSLSCPWCVDAHTTMLHATGHGAAAKQLTLNAAPDEADEATDFVTWARATGEEAAIQVLAVPFPKSQAAEYVAVVTEFHFLARAALVFLDETFLAGGDGVKHLVRRASGRVLRGKARRLHPVGAVAETLGESPLPLDLSWSADTPHIAAALAGLAAATDPAAVLPAEIRELVERHVAERRGEQGELGTSWASELADTLPAMMQPVARLLLLVATASSQITDGDVRASRELLATDEMLLVAVAWAAFLAARRVGAWTWAASEQNVPAETL